MRIDHIAVYVRDLEGAREFFQRYFGAVSNDRYQNRATGFQSYFLTFHDGSRLELMTKPGLIDCGSAENRFGYTHLALSAGSRHAVDALYRRLAEDGYPVNSEPRRTGDGYYECSIFGVEQILLEISI